MKRDALARRAFLGSPLVAIGGLKAAAGCGGAGAPRGQEPKLAGEPRLRRDFVKDGRSRRVVFVAHCVLNQNARHYHCAAFPALMKPLVAAMGERAVGMVQLPCPELMALGLGRDRNLPPADSIRDGLELGESQTRLHRLIDQVIYQIKEYQWQGFQVAGILGIDTSPSCGVKETNYPKTGRGPGEGVFIRLLRQRLQAEKLDIGIKGIDDLHQEDAIAWVTERL